MRNICCLLLPLACLALSVCLAIATNSKASTTQNELRNLDSNSSQARISNSSYKIAVTKPPVCNDFPVAFRVKTPDNEVRVRPVQKTTLGVYSEDTFKYATSN
jgi:hypothetical protein